MIRTPGFAASLKRTIVLWLRYLKPFRRDYLASSIDKSSRHKSTNIGPHSSSKIPNDHQYTPGPPDHQEDAEPTDLLRVVLVLAESLQTTPT